MYQVYRMNIYAKNEGGFLGYIEAFTLEEVARLVQNELEHENAVELVYMTTLNNTEFRNIQTDSDGYCHLMRG